MSNNELINKIEQYVFDNHWLYDGNPYEMLVQGNYLLDFLKELKTKE